MRLRIFTSLAVFLSALTLGACTDAGPGTAGGAPPSSVPSGFTADETAKIDAAARASLANGVTGTIVGISDPRRGNLLKAYGTADTAGTPMTPDMHYRIASVTKTFTADAVLHLVDERKVSLDDPVAVCGGPAGRGQDHRPGPAGDAQRGVRLRRRPGVLRAVHRRADLSGWTAADAVAIMRAHAAEFTPPNQKTDYCNSNYVLLG